METHLNLQNDRFFITEDKELVFYLLCMKDEKIICEKNIRPVIPT
jgi:hypothetical protein